MILFTCLLWLLAAAMTFWVLWQQQAQPETAGEAPAPRDPVAEQVAKWMHDWDRGRA